MALSKITNTGIDNITIDSSGNVGIGTTSPSTYGKLAVYKASGDVEAAVVTGSANYATYRVQNNAKRYSMQIRTDQSNAFVIRDETAGANRMLIDSSGRVTKPYQPSFGVYTTTGQTVGNTIQFNGTSFNIGNHFNTSTGIFTAPVSGRYWLYWHLLTDRSTNTGETYVDLFKNGGYHYRNYEPKESSLDQHVEFKGGLIVDMATNDTVYLVYTVAVSGNIVGSLQHCTFSGFLIG